MSKFPILETGDIVVCISDMPYDFTVGKKYTVILWTGVHLDLINDVGKKVTCFTHDFTRLSDYRNKKLGDIGI